MSDISRRSALGILATVPAAAGLTWTEAEAQQAQRRTQAARRTAAATGRAYKPKFFTPDEYATVRVLVDLIIPKDERSGSATDAGVPEFMDFMMLDQSNRQIPMRGGLRWLDAECNRRFGSAFLKCTPAQQTELLDLMAWPKKAPAELSQGVAFFNSFRDLTSTGFWSSKMGIEDLQYKGNTLVMEWTGCPAEALEKLGVSYEGYPLATTASHE